MGIRYHDKILPNQRSFSNLFGGGATRLPQALFAACTRFAGIPRPEKKYRLSESRRIRKEEMGSNPIMLRWLEILVSLVRPRRILEIGTFIGLSTMSLARNLPRGGKVLTIEKFPPIAALARRNFRVNGFSSRIRLLEGDALDLQREIVRFSPRYDFVFIDGNKENYDRYLRFLAPRVRPGGVILVDDALFHGDCLNARPRTAKGRGVQRSLRLARSLRGFQKILLPLANGSFLLLKER